MPAASTPRSGARLAIELVVGISLSLLLVGVSLALLLNLSLLSQSADCSEVGCDPGQLAVILVVGAAVIVFGAAISIGLFIVRLIQRRWAFYWPAIGLGIVVLAIFLVFWVVGLWAEASL
ncbi:hypothetical protein [Homoserinibacter sp. YIM 151385]|uniref:hypothetical protein n=1 Tax=Homoserinibacter sp. YIM 151385 TaxID=2985506 RepID=UPI0022F05357|nr:hypothetical protein [Homoserinibacter sp. YIM 151385]WBU38344.1 hypothetical protein OF852_01805 [Homoserinibacter sp. YIM 151385]